MYKLSQFSYEAARTCASLIMHARQLWALNKNKSLAYILCEQTLNRSYTGSISLRALESVESNDLGWKWHFKRAARWFGHQTLTLKSLYTTLLKACGCELPAVWRAGWSWLQSWRTGQRSCPVSCNDMSKIARYDEGVFRFLLKRSHLIIQPFKVRWMCLTKRGLQSKVTPSIWGLQNEVVYQENLTVRFLHNVDLWLVFMCHQALVGGYFAASMWRLVSSLGEIKL